MEILKKIGKICFVLLVAIALVVDGLFIYYHFFVKDFTTGTNYIGDQVGLDIKKIIKSDELTDEEKKKYEDRWFLEANYYSNSNNNGVKLRELKLNYFTDYRLTSEQYLSTGMQYVGEYTDEVKKTIVMVHLNDLDNYVFPYFNYYDSKDGELSYSGYVGANAGTSTMLKRSTVLIVKIGDKPYAIQLNKFGELTTKFLFITKQYPYPQMWQNFFGAVMQSIVTNSKGYGDYYIQLNLSDYFSIYAFDENGKKYESDEVTDYVSTYSVLKFHYDENGATRASQSIFGTINFDKNYGEHNTEYWQERFVYNLTEKDLLFRQSEQYGGHLATLGAETKNKFDQMQRAKVNISINFNSEYLKNKNINVVGLDYLAFENFEIDTLTITGSCDNFQILNQSLKNTNLKTLKHSKSIILNIHDGAIDSEFSEVVI